MDNSSEVPRQAGTGLFGHEPWVIPDFPNPSVDAERSGAYRASDRSSKPPLWAAGAGIGALCEYYLGCDSPRLRACSCCWRPPMPSTSQAWRHMSTRTARRWVVRRGRPVSLSRPVLGLAGSNLRCRCADLSEGKQAFLDEDVATLRVLPPAVLQARDGALLASPAQALAVRRWATADSSRDSSLTVPLCATAGRWKTMPRTWAKSCAAIASNRLSTSCR